MKFMTQNTVRALPGYQRNLLDRQTRTDEKNLAAEIDAAGRELMQMMAQLSDEQKADPTSIQKIAQTLLQKGYRMEAVKGAAKAGMEYTQAIMQKQTHEGQMRGRQQQDTLFNRQEQQYQQGQVDDSLMQAMDLGGSMGGPEYQTPVDKSMLSPQGYQKFQKAEDEKADTLLTRKIKEKQLNASPEFKSITLYNKETGEEIKVDSKEKLGYYTAKGFGEIKPGADTTKKDKQSRFKYISDELKAWDKNEGVYAPPADRQKQKKIIGARYDAEMKGWQVKYDKEGNQLYISQEGDIIDEFGKKIGEIDKTAGMPSTLKKSH